MKQRIFGFRSAIALALPICAAGLSGFLLSPLAVTAQAQSLQEQIAGAWRLVSIYEEKDTGEDIAIFGTDPRGQFMATRDGQFSFQIISRDGRRLAANRQASTVSDGGAGLREALAYYGIYSLDEARGTLTLHVAYCLFRSCDRSQRSAYIKFAGDRMEFVSVVGPTPTGSAHSFLTWERER